MPLAPSAKLMRPHELEAEEVHVWRANLELAPDELDGFASGLSPDERARAERFRFPRDRNRFIAARGILRHILSAYLDRRPGELRFEYGRRGKPSLAEESSAADLCFNLSHSSEVALFALTRHRPIGVDIECMRSSLPCERIAQRFFAPNELSKLLSLPQSQTLEAFFNCWTRKEAYIKAVGEGLFAALDRFEVSLAPGEPAALLNVEDDLEEASRWTIKNLSLAPGYAGAVAVKGLGLKFKFQKWPRETPK